jgi:hypothetical protein
MMKKTNDSDDMLVEFDKLKNDLTKGMDEVRRHLQAGQYSNALQQLGHIAKATSDVYVGFANYLMENTKEESTDAAG